MSNPSGRLPQSVYWRRRMLLLLGVVAIVAIIVLIVVRPGSATGARNDQNPPAADKSHVTGAPSDSASPAASGAAAAGAACSPSKVAIVALTDKASYAAGVQPQLSMSITNSGSSPCTFDVGTGVQDYVITSGTEKIWDSKDCQTGPTSDVQTLTPGKTLTTQPFAWDRTRSSTTTCSAARAAVVAGGASYHLAASVGAAKSAATKQFILN